MTKTVLSNHFHFHVVRMLRWAPLACILLASLTGAAAGGIVEISPSSEIAPKGTAFVAGATNLVITPVSTPAYTYSSYVVSYLVATGSFCRVSFSPPEDEPYKVILIDGSKEMATRGGLRRDSDRASFVVRVKSGASLRLVLYHPGRNVRPIKYEHLDVRCAEQPDPSWPAVEGAILGEIIEAHDPSLQPSPSPVLKKVISHFQRVAAPLRSGRLDISADFRTIQSDLSAAYPTASSRDLKALYASYLTHFAIPLTELGGDTAEEVLRQGSGTCWQQVLVAESIIKQLLSEKVVMRETDRVILGHTVLVAPDLIIDPTDNIVIPIAPARWNDLSVDERTRFLRLHAYFGMLARQDERATWLETVRRWPNAAIRTIPPPGGHDKLDE